MSETSSPTLPELLDRIDALEWRLASIRVWLMLRLATLRGERAQLAVDGRDPNKVHDLTEQIYALAQALEKFDETGAPAEAAARKAGGGDA